MRWCWTTTPWTIPVNQGIAYNPEVEYVLLVEIDGRWPVRSLATMPLVG